MDKKSFFDLAEKIGTGVATEQEITLFHHWYESFQEEGHEWLDEMGDRDKIENEIFFRIRNQINGGKLNSSGWQISRKIAAAVLLLLISAGAVYFVSYNKASGTQPELVIKDDVQPGGDKAILTLGDGVQIILDGTMTGVVANEGNIAVENSGEGMVTYWVGEDLSEMGAHEVTYNTISTPQGGQYKVRLPDETEVWLNSLSSIRFPTRFSDEFRKVEITGEVYFQVTNQENQPFMVYSGNQYIEVLGTEFNVQAYSDESFIRTTLVEGAVRVVSDNEAVSVKPGYQVVNQKNAGLEVRKVDTDMVTAWKDGLFQFWDTDLEEVMRQLSRWYGIEVNYVTAAEGGAFTGFISRNVTISNVLRMMEEAGNVKFGLEGKEVFVKRIAQNELE